MLYSRHDSIKVSGEQLQAPRIEQKSALTACLTASGTAGLRVRELLVLSQSRYILRTQTQAIVGYGSGCRGLRWRAGVLLLLLLTVGGRRHL